MSKTTVTDEVAVLRFFESGPLDKVEAVFNIVCEKMRERTRERGGNRPPGAAEEGAQRRRRKNAEGAAEPETPPAG